MLEGVGLTLINEEAISAIHKMCEVIKINHADSERLELGRHSIPLLKNPRLLAGMIDTNYAAGDSSKSSRDWDRNPICLAQDLLW